jgi:signal transduction histidine kinase
VSTVRRATGLRSRVTGVAALVLLLVLAVAGVALVQIQRAILVDGLEQNISDRADVIAAQLTAGEEVQRRDLPADDVLVQVVDEAGRVVAGSPGLDRPSFGVAAIGTTVSDGELPDGHAARVLAERVGADSIYVLGSLEDVEASTRTLVRSLLIGVPVSAAVLAGMLWWLVGRVLRPVEDIRAEVDRISASRLDRRVPEPRTGDEIARLASTMNAMLDRLDGASDTQRRFVADAAHELRSPLARIRAQLEVDRAHPQAADPTATQESVLVETAGLQRLVDDLLLLARGDSGALGLRRAGPVDLDDVIEHEAVARRSATALHIDTRGVVPIQVTGDRGQLARAVGNLLDNAVRHARTRIAVTGEEVGGRVRVTVTDDGPGIPAEQAAFVFQRFTRLDDARSAGDGGAGLGLAIARDIVVRHGGSLDLESAAPTGARFVLSLPSGEPGPSRGVDPPRGDAGDELDSPQRNRTAPVR